MTNRVSNKKCRVWGARAMDASYSKKFSNLECQKRKVMTHFWDSWEWEQSGLMAFFSCTIFLNMREPTGTTLRNLALKTSWSSTMMKCTSASQSNLTQKRWFKSNHFSASSMGFCCSLVLCCFFSFVDGANWRTTLSHMTWRGTRLPLSFPRTGTKEQTTRYLWCKQSFSCSGILSIDHKS